MKRFRSERLTAARVELGLTQEQAAHAVGVDVRTYRRYESGEVNGRSSFVVGRASRRMILARMEREFGLGLDELVGEVPAVAGAVESPHVLPRSRHTISREPLESDLVDWAQAPDDGARVVVVHAIGGAGKTTLLERVLARGACPTFVWSFYEDRRTEAFLGALARAYGTEASDHELTDRALRALRGADAPLIALDGLETMQSTGTDGSGRARGELVDPRMRLLLRHLAQGVGRARAIVTTRTPLADLDGWEGRGVRSYGLAPLAEHEMRKLLRQWGVTLARQDALIAQAAGHALSAAVLGSLASSAKRDGDHAEALAKIDLEEAATHDVLAARLTRVLTTYGDMLAPLDRDVLRRACALSSGVDVRTLTELSRGSPEAAGALAGHTSSAFRRSLVRLESMGLLAADSAAGRLSAHPFVRQHFQRELGEDHRQVHEALRRARADALTSHTHEADGSNADAIEALLEHTLRAGDGEAAFKLYAHTLGGFGGLGLQHGEMSRGLRITQLFATNPITGEVDPLVAERALTPSWNARLHYDRGLYLGALGDLDAALAAYQTVIDIAVRAGDEGFHMTALRTLGYTELLRGAFDHAARAVSRSLELACSFDSVGDVIRGTSLLGAIRSHAGDHAAADDLFHEARAHGDKPIARRGLWEAEHAFRCGDLDDAKAQTARNLEVCIGLGWDGHVAHCHTLLGSIACAQGLFAEAEAHLAAALPWTHRSSEAEMLLRTGELELAIARARGTATTDVLARGTELATLGGFRLFPDFVPS